MIQIMMPQPGMIHKEIFLSMMLHITMFGDEMNQMSEMTMFLLKII
jgi:hypothetical protein